MKRFLRYIGLLIAVLIGIGIGYVLHWGFRPAESGQPGLPAVPTTEQLDQPTTMWTCSMHPDVRLPKPGLCPKCRMELIPDRVTPEEKMSGLREFSTTENAKALMDIETVTVERKFVMAEIRMVGKVDYDETRLAYISAWLPGRLDRLFVDYTGVPVRKGDHMVYVYSAELLAAQEELIQAHKAVENLRASDSKMIRSMTQAMVEAAREKLRLWGLTPEQVAEIEKRGTTSDHMTIYAPISGIVIHKNAQEGMYVNTGTRIYTVADLSQVWVKLDAYESDLMWLRYGQEVEFTTVSHPGETFKGTISFIDPVLNSKTRTVKVRVNAPNTHGKLKPEMFVKAVVRAKVAAGGMVMDPKLAGKWICPMHPSIIKTDAGACDICQMPLVRTESLGYVSVDPTEADRPLVIPVSAALVTGTRAIVYVAVPEKDKPRYEGREIVLGPRAGNYYVVRSGLRAGERVVTKGNFKIDSALQIQAKPSMMTPEGGGGSGGHQHGGPQKPVAGAGAKAMIQIPALSREQLRAVLSAAENVKQTFESKGIGQIRTAFAALEKSVKAVDMTALEGHSHMLWMEMAMRLGNDAVEGQNAKTIAEARLVLEESLLANASALRAKFGIAHAAHGESLRPVPPEFRGQLESVFSHYLAMQQALAKDEADSAASAARKIKLAVAAVDMKLLSEEGHHAWMQRATSLEKILASVGEVKDIEALRQTFALLSEEMSVVAKQYGSQDTLYQLRCPMAFNNRGGIWLQRDQKTRNPYFGESMPECGSVIEVIPGPTGTETGGHVHE